MPVRYMRRCLTAAQIALPRMRISTVRWTALAAIGVGCRRWITQHGLALNVDGELNGFDAVVPCGLTGKPVGSLRQWINGISMEEVQPLMRAALARRFDLNWCTPGPLQQAFTIADGQQG